MTNLGSSLISVAAGTLEMIANGASLGEVLGSLCGAIDALDDQMICTILLADADGRLLWPAAGPRAPQAWVDAITPLAIGPHMGSCGTAAFHRERMIVSDIECDPRWSGPPDAQLRAIALSHGLRAAAWKSKPSAYIVGKSDHTVQPELERFLAKRMKATTYEVESSHVPMLSNPKVVIEAIRTVAGVVQGAMVG